MKAAVIYHKADYDGQFSGDICRFFLEQHGYEVDMYPYDYGEPDPIPDGLHQTYDRIYMVDLSSDDYLAHPIHPRIVWIDHHKTAIEKYSSNIPGLRIDGVAACRLCWQWFNIDPAVGLQDFKDNYINRCVIEPEIVRLAGEYDVWDKRDQRAEVLQYGLKAQSYSLYESLVYWKDHGPMAIDDRLESLLNAGESARKYADSINKDILSLYGQKIRFYGMTFLSMNWPARSSLAFEGNITEDVQALMSWFWTGDKFRVSLYGHSKSDPSLDLSRIAKSFGGGGHRQACGFQVDMETIQDILKGHYSGLKL